MKKRQIKIVILVIFSIIIFFLIREKVANYSSKNNKEPLFEAMYYSKLSKGKVQCVLCPKKCIIKDGQRGFCNTRINKAGKLYSLVYGRPIRKPWILSVDKMPLLSVVSGHKALMVSTVGCNMRCKFCLTWYYSQAKPEEIQSVNLTPEDIITQAIENNCNAIIYEGNEPTVFYEYMLDIAKLAKKRGILNLLVTSGYINPEPLRQLCKYMDIIILGIKGPSDEFYRKYCGGELKPVLEAIKIISEEKSASLHIAYVTIPTLSDDMEQIRQLATYIKNTIGEDVPFCIQRYKPSYKLINLPLTPIETLIKAQKVAKEVGLKNVFIREYNITEPAFDECIYCSKCHKPLACREGMQISVNNIQNDRCKFCGQEISVFLRLKNKQNK